VDDDGRLQIPASASLLLAIKPAEDNSQITCVSGQETETLDLVGAGRHLVEVTLSKQAASRPIHLQWDGLPLNSLAPSPPTQRAVEPAVLIGFAPVLHTAPVAFHRASCRARLLRVRTADDQISDIRGDPRLRGKLRSRRAGEFEWQSEDLSFPAPDAPVVIGQATLPMTKVARINAVLKDTALDVTIDFGPCGEFFSAGLAPADVRPSHVRIPRRLRARIEWLCKASRSYIDAERRPVSSLDDAALLRHISNLTVPVPLLANQRALERELRQIQSGLQR
jgi:hypothetical protein